ncbi:MAG: phosphatidate cytidylyltransferase [Desulfobacteraceae bacterium]|jgi:phosphatidate cytidylyltransferase
MHLKRWITGLLALPLLIVIIARGGSVLFGVCIALVAGVALWEYYRIVFHPQQSSVPPLVPLLGYLAGIAVIGAAHTAGPAGILAVLTANLILAGILGLIYFKAVPTIPEILFKQLAGSLYIPLSLAHLVLLRTGEHGVAWIFFLVGVIFAGDIGAFYTGTHLGRNALCPSVSPKKTIEGALGGLAANLLVGVLFFIFVLPPLPWGIGLAALVAMGACGQAGDLFESVLKRAAGVKDSGGILPGHGGILDRIDALLFAAPLAYGLKAVCA